MEISVEFKLGAFTVRIVGDNAEEVGEEINGLISMLDDATSQYESLGQSPQEYPRSVGTDEEPKNVIDGEDSGSGIDPPLQPIAARTGVDPTELEELIYYSIENEELPYLLLDDPEVLGDSVPEQQMNAALVSTLVWKECYGNEKMKTSDIKEVFLLMGISQGNLSRAWDDRYFVSGGYGASATIKVRGPGEREAINVIKSLLDKSGD